ncbi:putative bifunctional diguanylate cyclase/phosphodiesterase [Amycolatopsis cihanbeyliensis]|uniref:PAS domain S-box-containing protein/diguanylate cyclase (GGDEF)-like protein n=1 Tax=Amycolatopsis cihanbeyliensis TaxID=1128664 RepID=A0A542DRA5_AMYCI|nr:EAL domain-containing protein [Amycolatopsis cihanbeyliensis]TQJ05566.1 PAS domain S-box-containing protein/diguanylate cyclase (GGDEF)-like protein [Amycolatopsis cihanbeyliensis]
MTLSLSGDLSASAGVPEPRGTDVRWRAKLARKWARRLGTGEPSGLGAEELEPRLAELVDRLCAIVTGDPFAADQAVGLGAGLAELDRAGETTLRCTLDVLGKNLLRGLGPRREGDLAERVLAVLAALAAGYSGALRSSTTELQESNLVESLRQARGHLESTKAQFDELFIRSASGVAITDLDGRLLRTNEAFQRILDRSAAELTELTLFEVVQRPEAEALRECWQDLLGGMPQPLRQWRTLMRSDGEAVLANLSISLLRDGEGRPDRYVTIVEDDTDLALLQNRMSHQSLHDMTTALPNRQFFTSYLEKALGRADPTTGVTVYHLDLDAFSLVADGLGRQVGDQLLRWVADRLRQVFADEESMVARFSGDEFAVAVENAPGGPDVVSTVARINEALAEPVYLDGRGVAASASIGVVHHPPRDIAPEELLRAADTTLRRARRNGCRQWELFDAGQDLADRERFSLAASMPGAWETGQIRPVYVPIVDLAQGTVVGIEAMLRWDHPEFGALPHEKCVELAERTGLTLPLGTWLMKLACERIGESGDLPFSVNLTPNQAVDPDLVSNVLRALEDSGMHPHRLRLVFPLRELVTERGEAADNLRVLADVGVCIVVRDFDGGLADLTCLEDLPVCAVRLARRLVDRLAPSTGRFQVAEVLGDLVRLMHSAGVLVVIDGVETAEQAAWWRDIGADRALGGRYAPAGPVDDPTALLP